VSVSPTRARLIGTRQGVAAGHYLAAQAAMQILDAGGNAIDAGVAGGIALGVVQTEFVNVAGVAPIILHHAASGETVTISGLGWWPMAADAAYFREHHGGRIPPGLLRTVVPAAPDAWITALARYGTLRFGEVAAAAIRFAEEGFPVARLMHEIIAARVEEYARWPSSAAVYLPGGRAPAVGDVFVQTDLARTLRYMADQEQAAGGDRERGLRAARDAFYRGDIAATIARHHAAEGGWLTEEDMAAFAVEVEAPVRGRYGDFEILACGPWCQGPAFPQVLGILDGVDLAGLGHNGPDYVHVVTEALKLAFADRHAYIADPRFVEVPLAAMLDPAYLATRRAMIDPRRAWPEMPPPGALGRDAPPAGPASTGPMQDMALDTSYIAVVDGAGNVFSATPSDGSSESPVIPGTGLVPSSRGTQSWTDPAHPACLAPGKRPRLTPNPAIVMGRDLRMPIGSPGNDVQVQAMLQVFLNLHVFGMTPAEAIEAPRFATTSYPRSSEPHTYDRGRLVLEDRFEPAVGDELAARGHAITRWGDWDWRAGGVCTIVAQQRRGTLEAAADPRRPGAALVW